MHARFVVLNRAGGNRFADGEFAASRMSSPVSRNSCSASSPTSVTSVSGRLRSRSLSSMVGSSGYSAVARETMSLPTASVSVENTAPRPRPMVSAPQVWTRPASSARRIRSVLSRILTRSSFALLETTCLLRIVRFFRRMAIVFLIINDLSTHVSKKRICVCARNQKNALWRSWLKRYSWRHRISRAKSDRECR